jgi:PAS domain S-box-containing protein
VGSEPPSASQSASEAEQFFDLAFDLFCIAGFDGYFKRVNPAYERTLGYSSRELMSRPFSEFVYPDDLQSTTDVLARLLDGHDVIGFEHRVICRDGSVRWLQWNTRTIPERAFAYCVGRDVTERRRLDAELRSVADEQAALRRVATLVAEGAPPSAVLDTVAAEMERLLGADAATLHRYEPNEEIIAVGGRYSGPRSMPVGTRVSHKGKNVASIVRRTGKPARIGNYETARGPIADFARSVESNVIAAVGAPIVVDGRVWGYIVTSWSEEPPPDTEERMLRFGELLGTAIANAESSSDLLSSRARLLTAGDEARRRVVRDLHDGAQQRLVHTIVMLKLAQRAFREDDGKAESLLGEALEQAERGNRELRELAHGILPAALTHGGLRAGIDEVVARLNLPVEVQVPRERLAAEIEASAYFIVAEALTNVVKHAQAGHAEVTAAVEDGALRVEIRDDGIGGADPAGHGLVGLADRATALGGNLKVESPSSGGTVVIATLPV